MKKYVIVGGAAGGAGAAARLRRLDEKAKITLLERGGHVSFAHCGLAYCIGGVVDNPEALLMRSPEVFAQRYNVDVRLHCEAADIARFEHTVKVKNLQTGRTFSLKYDKLVLATGACPVIPEIPGIGDKRIFVLHSFEDMDAVLAYLRTHDVRRAIVVGGGCIGLEAAENLVRRGVLTGVVESSDHVLPSLDYDMAQIAAMEVEQHGVSLGLNTSVVAFEDAGDEGLRVRLSSGLDAFADMVIAAAGVRPETSLARKAGLGIGITGGIIVDDHQQTTDKDIYAVGDAAEVEGIFGRALITLASPAARQGHVAADNIGGLSLRYKNTLGVFAMRLFDMQLGSAGLTETQLKSAGIKYEKVYTRSPAHAPYYPGAEYLIVKLLFDKRTGRIYGAQITGAAGVDKRLDVLATAMRAGLTADKLSELELCSAPPFGAVKDVVNIAGYVALGVMQGHSDVMHWHHVTLTHRMLIDVRTSREFSLGTLPGAVNIPVDELRARIAELPKGSHVLCFSATGERGYIAERILKQRGFDAKNLSGGFELYQIFSQGEQNESGKV